MKPSYPHDLPTATAWLAWCGETEPRTRNRRHTESCLCHNCIKARVLTGKGRQPGCDPLPGRGPGA